MPSVMERVSQGPGSVFLFRHSGGKDTTGKAKGTRDKESELKLCPGLIATNEKSFVSDKVARKQIRGYRSKRIRRKELGVKRFEVD